MPLTIARLLQMNPLNTHIFQTVVFNLRVGVVTPEWPNSDAQNFERQNIHELLLVEEVLESEVLITTWRKELPKTSYGTNDND